ncbi:ABC transporter substrate-binding protein [Clostridium thailandense]|uniref:ABC transporter substrate-binding protein n=1 Tax=Clostridium thailandense TaxID=2794346 RepID=UPI003988AAA6
MLYKKRVLTIFLLIILNFNIASCSFKKDTPKEKQLNIYVDVKDKESLNIVKIITDEYKKSNSKVKLTVNNAIGGNIEEDISKGSEQDIVITSRNNMIKLSRKGLLNDLGSQYDENKVSEKYYRIMNAYGRFEDKYYGMSLIPFTIEILYNKSAFAKLNLTTPSTINDLREVLKKLNDAGTRIPVILTDDIDINSGLASVVINNRVSIRKLESMFDSGPAAYKSLTEMQQAFDTIYGLVSSGNINKNTFEIGNEVSIEKFSKGDIPLIVCSSYYSNYFKDNNIMIAADSSNDPSTKMNIPIISNAIICTPINGKNGEEMGNFLKFIISEELNKKLVEKGFITGNKKANSTIVGGAKASIVKHLENSSDDSIVYVYNIPDKLRSSITSKIDQILNGKHTGKEWQEAVDEAYK